MNDYAVQILYPVFGMFALVAVVFVRMGWYRFRAIRGREVSIRYYRAYRDSDGMEPEPMRVMTRHAVNLFEVPVLFYVVALMAYTTGQVNAWMVGLAWLYVATRWVHSYIHLGRNNVTQRFFTFIFSGIVLMLLWVSLFVLLMA